MELRRDVQKDLQDLYPLSGELLLIFTNRLEAAVDLFLIHPLVHALNQDVFVVGTVEGHNLARNRIVFADAPQEIVLHFLFRGLAKTDGLRALRIKDGKDMANGPTFAGGIHALQDH